MNKISETKKCKHGKKGIPTFPCIRCFDETITEIKNKEQERIFKILNSWYVDNREDLHCCMCGFYDCGKGYLHNNKILKCIYCEDCLRQFLISVEQLENYLKK